MSQRVLKLSIAALLLITIPVNSLAAESKSDCTEIIKACDATIVAKDKEIELWRVGLSQVATENANLRYTVEDQEAKLRSPLRNPFVMTTLGVLVGIIVTGYALKK